MHWPTSSANRLGPKHAEKAGGQSGYQGEEQLWGMECGADAHAGLRLHGTPPLSGITFELSRRHRRGAARRKIYLRASRRHAGGGPLERRVRHQLALRIVAYFPLEENVSLEQLNQFDQNTKSRVSRLNDGNHSLVHSGEVAGKPKDGWVGDVAKPCGA